MDDIAWSWTCEKYSQVKGVQSYQNSISLYTNKYRIEKNGKEHGHFKYLRIDEPWSKVFFDVDIEKLMIHVDYIRELDIGIFEFSKILKSGKDEMRISTLISK